MFSPTALPFPKRPRSEADDRFKELADSIYERSMQGMCHILMKLLDNQNKHKAWKKNVSQIAFYSLNIIVLRPWF